jgi:hypothetical protein
MENIQVAFQVLPKDERPNPGQKQIRCHIVFDVKIDEARFIAGVH